MPEKINEYVNTATTIEPGSWFDMDQDTGGGNFQSQKVSPAVMRSALGLFYYANGQLPSDRDVDLNSFVLQFLNGQVGFGIAATLIPPPGAGVTQIINFNLGNNQKVDLNNIDNDVTFQLDNPVSGANYTIEIIQGINLQNVIWPVNVKWESGQPLIVTQTDSATDLVTLYYNGTNFLASFGSNYA